MTLYLLYFNIYDTVLIIFQYIYDTVLIIFGKLMILTSQQGLGCFHSSVNYEQNKF